MLEMSVLLVWYFWQTDPYFLCHPLLPLPLCSFTPAAVDGTFCCLASGVFSVVMWSLKGSSWGKRLEFGSLLLSQLKPEECDIEYDHRLSSDSCMRPVTSGIQHLCLFRQTFSSISVLPGVGEVTVSLCTSVATLMAYFPILAMVTLHVSKFAGPWLLAIRCCRAFSTRLMRTLVKEIFPL